MLARLLFLLALLAPAWGAVNSTTSSVQYTGTGTTAVFTYTWQIAQSTDLVAAEEVTATGVVTALNNGTDYTVTGAGVPTGGTITLTAGNLPSGTTLFVASDPAQIQTLVLAQGAPFNPAAISAALDLLCRQVQATRRVANVAIQIPTAESLSGLTTVLPGAAQRAGRALAFDVNGNATLSNTLPGPPAANSITQAMMQAGSIGTAQIINGSITNPLLAASAVQQPNLYTDVSYQVLNLAALRALSYTSPHQIVSMQGYTSAGDGGGGVFVWYASSSTADNGGTVINPTGNTGNGRYLRVCDPYYVDVRWFGATGSYSTDDTTAIQSAINAIPTSVGGTIPTQSYPGTAQGGYTVYFPPGVYTISSTLTIGQRRVMLRGSGVIGSNGTIIYSASTSNNMVDYHTGSLDTFSVYGIEFVGAGSGTGSANALYLGQTSQPVYDSQIHQCWFTGIPNAGVYMVDASDYVITDCVFENSTTGIQINASTSPASDIHGIGNCLFSNTNNGVFITSGVDIRITGDSFMFCESSSNNDGGVVVNVSSGVCRGLTVTGCNFRSNDVDVNINGNGGTDSANTGVNDVTISGNTMEKTLRRSVSVQQGNNITISGNTIHNASQASAGTYAAIDIEGASDSCTVDGNNVLGVGSTYQSYGITTGASVTNLTVGTNRLVGASGNAVNASTTHANNGVLESGSWTPTFVGTTIAGSFTYSNQTGNYMRIGNMVYAQCTVSISAIGTSPTGNLRIGGLPFAPANYDNCTLSHLSAITYGSSNHLNARLIPGSGQIELLTDSSGATAADLAATALGTTGEIDLSVIYRASN